MEFENKVAVVTGGGAGIGRACALDFAREGTALATPPDFGLRTLRSSVRAEASLPADSSTREVQT